MLKTITALCVLLAASSNSHAADCDVPFIKFIPGITTTGYMSVKSGKSCSIRVAESLGGVIRPPELAKRPSHGVVVIQGLGLRYSPKAGFVGKDRFEYVRHHMDPRNNKPVAGNIVVEVTVEP
jgi:hypothetical protein